jgi:hypothetical protein
MTDYRIPKTVKNRVLTMVQAIGLDPNDFEWSDASDSVDRTITSRITHRPTGYMFRFAIASVMGDVMVGAEWTPMNGEGKTFEAQVGNLDDQVAACKGWLRIVKGEHEAEDLWAAFSREAQIISGEPADGEQGFTDDERRLLLTGLEQIRLFVVTHADVDHVHESQINVTFQMCAAASERLTKREWKSLFVGALFSLLVNLSTNTDVIHTVFQLAATYILPVLGRLQLPSVF